VPHLEELSLKMRDMLLHRLLTRCIESGDRSTKITPVSLTKQQSEDCTFNVFEEIEISDIDDSFEEGGCDEFNIS